MESDQQMVLKYPLWFHRWLFFILLGSEGLAFPFPSTAPFDLPSAMSPRRELGRTLGPNGVFDRELRPNGSGSKTQDKLCSPSMGAPVLQQISLMDKGVP
jgi:hypothetical protein